MRRFNLSEDQSILKKRGIRSTNFAAELPNCQALSSLVSIGTLEVKPSAQKFGVYSPIDYALQRTPLAQSLQCKEVGDLVQPENCLYGIRENKRYTCKPHFGNQRGDPKGLAYDKIYPINNPLLVKSDTFFSYLKTPLKGVH